MSSGACCASTCKPATAQHDVFLQTQLSLAARHDREHRHAEHRFEFVRTFHAAIHRALEEGQHDADQQAAAERDQDRQHALRTHRLVRRFGEVHHPHVAHLAGFRHPQLLRAIQQIGIELRIDVHVAQQRNAVCSVSGITATLRFMLAAAPCKPRSARRARLPPGDSP
jgi:hypothetical protein